MESVNEALPPIQQLNAELLETIKQKTKEINDKKAELVKNLRPTFKELFLPFLQKYPQIKRIQWRQYTPYFNDGEECVFRVNDLYGFLDIEGEESYEGTLPMSDYYFKERGTPNEKDWQKKTMDAMEGVFGGLEAVQEVNNNFKEIEKQFGEIPEDVMKDLFGDHAEITVTLNGLDVEEHEHD